MVSWSALGRSIGVNLLKNNVNAAKFQNVAFSTSKMGNSAHRTMVMQPSRWQWHKFKDMLHFYVMVGVIPVGAIIFYANVFIGPAQLAPIPKDYVPKHWEYYSHPITRFIARYIRNNPQQDYEKFMHWIDEEKQKMKMRELEKKILKKMAERNDYQAYYYRPMVNKYLRINKQTGDEFQDRLGDNYSD